MSAARLIAEASAALEAGARPGKIPHQEHTCYSFGAQFAEVRVHMRLRELSDSRFDAGYAAGRVVNRRLAERRLIHGIVWGIGMA